MGLKDKMEIKRTKSSLSVTKPRKRVSDIGEAILLFAVQIKLELTVEPFSASISTRMDVSRQISHLQDLSDGSYHRPLDGRIRDSQP